MIWNRNFCTKSLENDSNSFNGLKFHYIKKYGKKINKNKGLSYPGLTVLLTVGEDQVNQLKKPFAKRRERSARSIRVGVGTMVLPFPTNRKSPHQKQTDNLAQKLISSYFFSTVLVPMSEVVRKIVNATLKVTQGKVCYAMGTWQSNVNNII